LDEQGRAPGQDALVQAQATIARQDAEIQRLRQQMADNRFADELRRSLVVAGAAGAIATPVAYTQLLRLLLETAAHVINSATASISLVDEERGELVIQYAVGPGAQQAEGLRFPLGHGVAGLVAATSQPMAISNASTDPRHAAEIAEQTGYRPNTILCVPLLHEERVLGVLQLLDKAGGRSFTTTDIETLGLFGAQAAIVVEQSRTSTSLSALIGQLLSAPGGAGGQIGVSDAAHAFAAAVEADSAYHATLELAQLVQRIASQGEQERQLCASLLQSFATYFAARPQLTLSGGIG